MRRNLVISILALGPTAGVMAQSSVDSNHKHAWAENLGWTNWRDAGSPAGANGARVHDSFLSGFVWCENAGWINLGDGSPGNGVAYANATGADFGINIDSGAGELFGLAWGENVGWINFGGGALASPQNPARIESENGVCRLAGFAWGENIGWINLNDASHFVGVPAACGCELEADLNHDGAVSLSDLAILLAHFGVPGGATHEEGDLTGDGAVSLNDLTILLSQFGTACP